MKKKKKKAKIIKKNYCDFCGLLMQKTIRSKKELEELSTLFSKLIKLGFQEKGYMRKIIFRRGEGTFPHYQDFCAIGSKKWINAGNKCKDFQLKLKPLNLSDYISLYAAKIISRTSNNLAKVALFIALLSLIIAIF